MKFFFTFVFFLIPVWGWAQAGTGTRSPMVRQGLVFPLQDQHVHGSSLVQLPNKDLLVAWFQGSGERNADDVRIMGARLKAGEEQWTAPFLLADTPGLPDCNPVLFLIGDTLHLVWIAVQANRWEHSVLRSRRSTRWDGAAAPQWDWQDNIFLKPDESFAEEAQKKFALLPKLHHGWSEYAPPYDRQILQAGQDPTKRSAGWMTRIKPLVLEDGKILLPLYSDGFNFSMMALSTDHGASWKPGLPLIGRGPIQPALVQKADGSLVAYLRDSGDAPNRIQISVSADQGHSWSAARKTAIPNTASVEAIRMRDGRWVLLCNDVEDGRYQLSLLVSEDEGGHWKRAAYLEQDSQRKGSYSYPSLFQGEDELLYMSYSYSPESGKKSIKYQVIDPSAFTLANLPVVYEDPGPKGSH